MCSESGWGAIVARQAQVPTLVGAMPHAGWRRVLLLAVLGLAGCQVDPAVPLGPVVSVYASAAEAAAVAAGQFGAVPIALLGEPDLDLLPGRVCSGTTAPVRARDGRRGWVVVATLSRERVAAAPCVSESASGPRPMDGRASLSLRLVGARAETRRA